jgi:hypothetical protein
VDAEGRIRPVSERRLAEHAFVELMTRNTFPVVLVALIAVALSLLSPNLFVADTWLTLASGREIVQNGIPHHDELTIWSLGHRWTDQQWLAQLTWYGVNRVAGVAGVALGGALIVAVTYASAMAGARSLGATARSTFLVAFVAMFVAPWSWQVRAQSIALPLFVWTLWLAAAHVRRPSRRILVALPLLVLWANVHGSVVLGAIVVSLALILTTARERDRRAVGKGAGLLAATWLSVLVTPYGTDIFAYYRLMLVHPPFAKLISEWQRTTPSWLTAVFFVLTAITITLALWQRRRLRLFDTLVLVLTLAGALQALRGITWFTLAVVVLLPRLLDGAIRSPDVVQMPRANAALSLAAVTAATIVFVVVAAKPQSWFEREWPREVVAAVDRAGPQAKVLASDRHADWLLWRIPSLRGRLAYDVRFELYTRSRILALARFYYQRGGDWQRIANGYKVLVIDERSDSPPTTALLRQPGLRMVYHDDRVSVLERSRPPTRTARS